MPMKGTYHGADQKPSPLKHKDLFLEDGMFIDLSCTYGQEMNC